MASSAGDADDTSTAAGRIFSGIVAGLICGMLGIVLSIGAGSLLFAGDLHDHTAAAAGMALAGTVVLAAIMALTSSIRRAVAVAQEVPAVAMAPVIAAVSTAMSGSDDAAYHLPTVFAAVILTTIIVGAVTYILGVFKLGSIVRFVPYPVIGGFLAGTGWLIAFGGLGVVLGEAPTLDGLLELPPPGALANLAAAAVLVTIVLFLDHRSGNPLAIPVTVLAALVLFNIAVLFSPYDAESLRAINWLIETPSDESLWPPLGPDDIAGIDWGALLAGLISLPVVIVMTVIAMLMNDTGIELATSRDDIDLDRELRSGGSANFVSGIFGGLPGFPAVSLSLLAMRLTPPTRLVGLVVAVVTFGALMLGPIVLDLVPTFLLGGLLIWIGGALLIEWLIKTYWRVEFREFLIILLIFGAIVGVGFAEGILIGLIAAVVLFVVQYGQVDAVRMAMTGSEAHSSAEPSETRRQVLAESGDSILIYRLQGFLFFGTADRLRRQLIARISDPNEPPARYIIFDFQRVTGVDSSAVLSFSRIRHVAERHSISLTLCSLSPTLVSALHRGGLDPETRDHLRIEPDLDGALKYCEDALLAAASLTEAHDGATTAEELLTKILGDSETANRMIPYLERIEAPTGTAVIAEGNPSDDIFLVETGYLRVETQSRLQNAIRLATIGPGALIGELAYYLHQPRSASVISETDAVLCRLSRDSLDRMRKDDPDLAFQFHEAMAAVLADRLSGTNRLLRFLAD